MIKYFTVNAPPNRSLVRRLHHKVGPGCRSWTSRGRVRPTWPRRRLPVSAECLTASRWQPRRAAGVPLPSSVHQMEPAGPDLVHSVSSRDPSPGQNPYAPPRGTRVGAGTEGCSTGLLPRPRSCQSWSDSFRISDQPVPSRTHRRSYSKSAEHSRTEAGRKAPRIW
jgi:hypothetical protein